VGVDAQILMPWRHWTTDKFSLTGTLAEPDVPPADFDNKVTFLRSPSSTTGTRVVNMLNTLRFDDMLNERILVSTYCRLYRFPLIFAVSFLENRHKRDNTCNTSQYMRAINLLWLVKRVLMEV